MRAVIILIALVAVLHCLEIKRDVEYGGRSLFNGVLNIPSPVFKTPTISPFATMDETISKLASDPISKIDPSIYRLTREEEIVSRHARQGVKAKKWSENDARRFVKRVSSLLGSTSTENHFKSTILVEYERDGSAISVKRSGKKVSLAPRSPYFTSLTYDVQLLDGVLDAENEESIVQVQCLSKTNFRMIIKEDAPYADWIPGTRLSINTAFRCSRFNPESPLFQKETYSDDTQDNHFVLVKSRFIEKMQDGLVTLMFVGEEIQYFELYRKLDMNHVHRPPPRAPYLEQSRNITLQQKQVRKFPTLIAHQAQTKKRSLFDLNYNFKYSKSFNYDETLDKAVEPKKSYPIAFSWKGLSLEGRLDLLNSFAYFAIGFDISMSVSIDWWSALSATYSAIAYLDSKLDIDAALYFTKISYTGEIEIASPLKITTGIPIRIPGSTLIPSLAIDLVVRCKVEIEMTGEIVIRQKLLWFFKGRAGSEYINGHRKILDYDYSAPTPALPSLHIGSIDNIQFNTTLAIVPRVIINFAVVEITGEFIPYIKMSLLFGTDASNKGCNTGQLHRSFYYGMDAAVIVSEIGVEIPLYGEVEFTFNGLLPYTYPMTLYPLTQITCNVGPFCSKCTDLIPTRDSILSESFSQTVESSTNASQVVFKTEATVTVSTQYLALSLKFLYATSNPSYSTYYNPIAERDGTNICTGSDVYDGNPSFNYYCISNSYKPGDKVNIKLNAYYYGIQIQESVDVFSKLAYCNPTCPPFSISGTSGSYTYTLYYTFTNQINLKSLAYRLPIGKTILGIQGRYVNKEYHLYLIPSISSFLQPLVSSSMYLNRAIQISDRRDGVMWYGSTTCNYPIMCDAYYSQMHTLQELMYQLGTGSSGSYSIDTVKETIVVKNNELSPSLTLPNGQYSSYTAWNEEGSYESCMVVGVRASSTNIFAMLNGINVDGSRLTTQNFDPFRSRIIYTSYYNFGEQSYQEQIICSTQLHAVQLQLLSATSTDTVQLMVGSLAVGGINQFVYFKQRVLIKMPEQAAISEIDHIQIKGYNSYGQDQTVCVLPEFALENTFASQSITCSSELISLKPKDLLLRGKRQFVVSLPSGITYKYVFVKLVRLIQLGESQTIFLSSNSTYLTLNSNSSSFNWVSQIQFRVKGYKDMGMTIPSGCPVNTSIYVSDSRYPTFSTDSSNLKLVSQLQDFNLNADIMRAVSNFLVTIIIQSTCGPIFASVTVQPVYEMQTLNLNNRVSLGSHESVNLKIPASLFSSSAGFSVLLYGKSENLFTRISLGEKEIPTISSNLQSTILYQNNNRTSIGIRRSLTRTAAIDYYVQASADYIPQEIDVLVTELPQPQISMSIALLVDLSIMVPKGLSSSSSGSGYGFFIILELRTPEHAWKPGVWNQIDQIALLDLFTCTNPNWASVKTKMTQNQTNIAYSSSQLLYLRVPVSDLPFDGSFSISAIPSSFLTTKDERSVITPSQVSVSVTIPTMCPMGQYSSTGIHPCNPCPEGTYSSVIGAISCTSSSGSCVPSADKTKCEYCPLGAEANNGKCVNCASGHVTVSRGSSCTPCGPGTYAYMGNKCMSCEGGTYSSSTSNSECLPCPIGHFSTDGSSQCTPCGPGSYQNAPKMPSCKLCEANSFAKERGSTSCTKCEPGSEGDLPDGSYKCKPCKDGYSNGVSGSSCEICQAGYFATNGSLACTQCPVNTYSSASGSSSCTPCEKGTVSNVGSTKCTGNKVSGATSLHQAVPSFFVVLILLISLFL